MESSAESYLHKKFKKQLSSVEPRPSLHHEKEGKNAVGVVESSEEKIWVEKKEECSNGIDNQMRKDNNESVPNQSTNQSSSLVRISNFSKSSISVEKCIANLQSANSCISYVVSSRQDNAEQFRSPNFDTKTEPTSSSASTSSILDNLYTKQSYVAKPEDISSQTIQENDHFDEETSESKGEQKQEDAQPTPDKGSGGKYVCTYCKLVCSKPSVLQKHIRAHTNERPYPCNSCGFSFKTRSNLYKHCRSRTHANRVMGNKAQEINNEIMVEVPTNERKSPQRNDVSNSEERSERHSQDAKAKPYKPRFHTTKQFFNSVTKENIQDESEEVLANNKHTSSDLLSHHINEIISKNNSIINSGDPYLLKRRSGSGEILIDNNNEYAREYSHRHRSDSLYSVNSTGDEPLNLTNKNRKRCMSEVVEPVAQKSLIKELLLKNLNSDMQCPHCKMIFQTVTELELHKLRSCKGFVKPGAKYSRSSSVNVASILTQNKNAFDNIPHLQNAVVFPLKSPGPFLGKTRLVESDKSKSFSFDDGLPSTFSMPNSSDRYLLSPLTLQSDKDKKTPVRLFGGEVKITHTSGETKSFKIDSKNGDKFGADNNFVEYGGKLSENRVVKSGLQSGGTVLTNKPNYSKQDSLVSTHDIIRVYENTSISPSIDVANLSTTKFNFDKQSSEFGALDTATRSHIDATNFNSVASPSYKYTNIMDFSQKAVKLLTPNLRQPNLTVSGVSAPNKLAFRNLPNEVADRVMDFEKTKTDVNNISIQNLRKDAAESLKSGDKFFQPKTSTPVSQNLYNPMNLLVNGKVVRYVPGIPGPIAAEEPVVDMVYGSGIVSTSRPLPSHRRTPPLPKETDGIVAREATVTNVQKKEFFPKSPKLDTLEVNMDFVPKLPDLKSSVKTSEKSPTKLPDMKKQICETQKFARPNSLALKPTTASLKQHHGLTPTMFNQILISPDTPRVAKKYVHQFLHGNYFSYLGLKCSTKPVYCTLNKTQPFYVPHFKKLSMYSEWRQQDTKTDKLYVSAYDSRQKPQRYTTAGKSEPDFVVHSSYKFIVSESSGKGEKTEDQQKPTSILGGYECNDDYTYIRGRGRGRYVCDQCGIRCKKPSMLKKHIRTHSNDRPYTCSHCNFSFKTKGNLTKHMKSKAHTKNYAATGSSGSSTQQSGTQSSESDTDDSGMDSSDESTRREEHEAAYGLLSLSQKTSQNITNEPENRNHSPTSTVNLSVSDAPLHSVMDTEEIVYVSKTNYAKNKTFDEKKSLNFSAPKNLSEIPMPVNETTKEIQNLIHFLGKTTINRPLTYPYTSILSPENRLQLIEATDAAKTGIQNEVPNYEKSEAKSIKQFHVIQKYGGIARPPPSSSMIEKIGKESPKHEENIVRNDSKNFIKEGHKALHENDKFHLQHHQVKIFHNIQPPILKVNDADVLIDNTWDNRNSISDLRKRKFNMAESSHKTKILKNDEVMDLSVEKNANIRLNCSPVPLLDEALHNNYVSPIKLTKEQIKNINNEVYSTIQKNYEVITKGSKQYSINEDDLKINEINYKNNEYNKTLLKNNGNVTVITPLQSDNVNINYVVQEQQPVINSDSPKSYKSTEYDNSAMETLADIATKQVKLEKNTLAKSVASEFLKIATKNEFPPGEGVRDPGGFGASNKEINELIVKSEGSKSCGICSKSFSKPSQLRLHMNIHYLERPFRCHSCSVSFRTKGHLQKHERSASHHNKLSSSPALSSSEPRPFKCVDCSIAFRIHGHLAKHLRSKMHIMKLECLAKIPFGLYAELERSNSLLTEINTADGDQCLESLKTLAKKVFINDPNKLNQLNPAENIDVNS